MELPGLHLETRPDCMVKPSTVSPLPFTVIGGFLGAGKTTILEVEVTQELGDPFRRDALKYPARMLDKYKHTDVPEGGVN